MILGQEEAGKTSEENQLRPGPCPKRRPGLSSKLSGEVHPGGGA